MADFPKLWNFVFYELFRLEDRINELFRIHMHPKVVRFKVVGGEQNNSQGQIHELFYLESKKCFRIFFQSEHA